MSWPPQDKRQSLHWLIASINGKLRMLRAEPWPTPFSMAMRTAGRPKVSTIRLATMPTMPACQPGEARTIARMASSF